MVEQFCERSTPLNTAAGRTVLLDTEEVIGSTPIPLTKKMYVLVRKDLSPSQQIVQSCHAVAEFVKEYNSDT